MRRTKDLVVGPETKVGDLLEAYPEAEGVLIGLAPQFKALGNPLLRRTVARVTSLEQAARVGGVPVGEMIHALRSELGLPGREESPAGAEATITGGPPSWLEAAEPTTTVDAGALLDAGETPVSEASQRLAHLGAGEVLLITAPFQPAPLIDTLRGKGHEVFARPAGEGWEVWVRKA